MMERGDSRWVLKVLLPVLADQYGRVLEKGELRLEYQGGAFHVLYVDKQFPVAPRTCLRSDQQD
jgi:maltooligosyltrehalose synthase